MNPKKVPISQQFDDKHNKVAGPKKDESQFLKQDRWQPAVLELARTMKDDFVYGKPKLDLFYKGLKPEHVMTNFDGTHGPLKVIR